MVRREPDLRHSQLRRHRLRLAHYLPVHHTRGLAHPTRATHHPLYSPLADNPPIPTHSSIQPPPTHSRTHPSPRQHLLNVLNHPFCGHDSTLHPFQGGYPIHGLAVVWTDRHHLFRLPRRALAEISPSVSHYSIPITLSALLAPLRTIHYPPAKFITPFSLHVPHHSLISYSHGPSTFARIKVEARRLLVASRPSVSSDGFLSS